MEKELDCPFDFTSRCTMGRCNCKPKQETVEDYLQRLKDRRTEDDYKYTDEDFEKHKDYIENCYQTNLSVYKCLEFMWFQTEEAEDNFKKLNIIENGK